VGQDGILRADWESAPIMGRLTIGPQVANLPHNDLAMICNFSYTMDLNARTIRTLVG
jgi:hypothetical protein